MKQILFSIAFLFAPLAPAAAQAPISLCGLSVLDQRQELGPQLEGFWTVEFPVGSIEQDGRVTALPPGIPSFAGLTVDPDGDLLILAPELKGEYPLTWVEAGSHRHATPDTVSVIEAAHYLPDEVAATPSGCGDTPSFPHLRAEGQFTDQHGTIAFEMLLHVVSPNQHYGVTVGHLGEGQGMARRIVSFSR